MDLFENLKHIFKTYKLRGVVSYTGFYYSLVLFCRARVSVPRVDQFYASYPAGTELLKDTAKLYKSALGNCIEAEEWGPIEFALFMAHLSQGQLDGSVG
ncbi:hypothetical protein MKX01_034902 [Papaver californicum]|nr:hypothetical protein MKX01_034902 [Papaver californicum]